MYACTPTCTSREASSSSPRRDGSSQRPGVTSPCRASTQSKHGWPQPMTGTAALQGRGCLRRRHDACWLRCVTQTHGRRGALSVEVKQGSHLAVVRRACRCNTWCIIACGVGESVCGRRAAGRRGARCVHRLTARHEVCGRSRECQKARLRRRRCGSCVVVATLEQASSHAAKSCRRCVRAGSSG